ncbi:hypothetical protein AK830_g12276 [Neonectria ditissima]|uniref:Actin-like ATPase domain-containing protein n=1 Tax=Neonectria ditissima TaxID=78410 RepID=A0A0P7B0S0_9HYPO|nr:hypothetical protein AK830_g12276 [Neonectria ditissima]
MSSTQHEIVIAIDFGASLTKVALANSFHKTIACDFPSHPPPSVKIPSVLYVHPDGSKRIGRAPPSGDGWVAIKWFKLLLLHEDDWPTRAKDSLLLGKSMEAVRRLRLTPLEVVADFFSELWPEIQAFASENLVAHVNGNLLSLNLHLVLTVPACWPNDAMARMERAAKDAGILEGSQSATLTFMREQEVIIPGLLANNNRGSRELSDLKVPSSPSPVLGEEMLNSQQSEDLVTVCDCGGLTIDASTYQVSITGNRQHRLDERVPGGSRLGGAIFLEDGFYKCLEDKICSIFGNKEASKELTSQFWSKVAQWWDQAGRATMLGCQESSIIDLPYSLEFKDGSNVGDDAHQFISFSGQEFVSIRQPVLASIVDLVQSQIREACQALGGPPKFLILCGGMAMNSIISRELQEKLDAPIRIAVVRDDPDLLAELTYRRTLVSRGAALQAQGGKHPDGNIIVRTTSHVTRESYGIRVGETQAVNWIIKEGTSLSPTKPQSFDVPSAAFKVRTTLSGPGLSLTLYRQGPSYQGVRTVCCLTWVKDDPIILPRDIVKLQVLHNTYHGISVFLTHNGQRIGPERVIVDY